jgi:Outer membrane protein beta-barrel domain
MSRALIFFVLLQVLTCGVWAQQGELNLPNHGDKRYYFGITFAYNRATFNLNHHPRFLQYDTVQAADPVFSGGFSMGFIGNLRLSPRFELRYNPQLVFAEKSVEYHLKYPVVGLDETPVTKKKIESVIFSSPIHLKLNSDRIGNFSFYSFVGAKIDFDLASNARKKRAEDLVKISATDFGVEAGVGFQIYFESFIFTPEIKISHGINNIHFRDEGLKFSNVLDQMRSRMIVFSIHLQG